MLGCTIVDGLVLMPPLVLVLLLAVIASRAEKKHFGLQSTIRVLGYL